MTGIRSRVAGKRVRKLYKGARRQITLDSSMWVENGEENKIKLGSLGRVQKEIQKKGQSVGRGARQKENNLIRYGKKDEDF